jgi:hypothetical protein
MRARAFYRLRLDRKAEATYRLQQYRLRHRQQIEL